VRQLFGQNLGILWGGGGGGKPPKRAPQKKILKLPKKKIKNPKWSPKTKLLNCST